MSRATTIPPPPPPLPQSLADDLIGSAPASSLWERISGWMADNKTVVYAIAGVSLVATATGIVYYTTDMGKSWNQDNSSISKPRTSRGKRKGRKDVEESRKGEGVGEGGSSTRRSAAVADAEEEGEERLPEVNDEIISKLSEQERKDYAGKYKAAGNKAYGQKAYMDAIDLYSKALLCKQDPVFYSNRAACWNSISKWDKVIEDTTAAINLDSEYVKAINRRANAYEQKEMYSDALLDFTASCIIDGFRNDGAAHSLDRLLKKVAEPKAKAILAGKEKKMPSPTFINNYLQSFRPRPAPTGLEEGAEVDENSGKGQLKSGLIAMNKKTAEGYAEASERFDKALELGDLDESGAFAYSMRGTFRFLKNENESALADLTKSIEVQPSLTQSYIKRASMFLEIGDRDAAAKDFDAAIEQNKDDPDIYYHRAQLQFIQGDFAEAAKDYQKSIELDSSFIFSHIQLGVTQYKMGSIASSMATFRRCIKNFERFPDVYNYYGELLMDQQKYEEAIEKFDAAVEMEKRTKPMGMNVIPLINKALALFQWKQDFSEAEDLCSKALIIDPECDIAVVTMAQFLLQQGKATEALKYFEKAAELSRTEAEVVNMLSYAEATRTQLQVQERYPQLASRLQGGGAGAGVAGSPGRE